MASDDAATQNGLNATMQTSPTLPRKSRWTGREIDRGLGIGTLLVVPTPVIQRRRPSVIELVTKPPDASVPSASTTEDTTNTLPTTPPYSPLMRR